MKNQTYKDFNDALIELKHINNDISYGKISMATGILESTLNALANRRRAHPPSDEIIKKISTFFKISPDYFYEYRLSRLLKIIDKNRDFLDYCLKQTASYKKES